MALSAKVEGIIHEVAALSDDERDELMVALDAEVSAEWMGEVSRRTREIDGGKVQLVTEEDFLRKLRAV